LKIEEGEVKARTPGLSVFQDFFYFRQDQAFGFFQAGVDGAAGCVAVPSASTGVGNNSSAPFF